MALVKCGFQSLGSYANAGRPEICILYGAARLRLDHTQKLNKIIITHSNHFFSSNYLLGFFHTIGSLKSILRTGQIIEVAMRQQKKMLSPLLVLDELKAIFCAAVVA